MKKKIFAVASLVLVAAAPPVQAAPAGLDQIFAITVSQGNNAEVMASRLALKKSSSKRVRKLANLLAMQHGAAEASLKQVAASEKIHLPAGTDEKHRALYSELQGLSGAAFDRKFIEANVGDHYKTIALFNKEMANGKNTAVRSFATRYLPDIETHTQMITAIASNYHIPVATRDAGTGPGSKMNSMTTKPAAKK
jgi:putative membrane protein